MIPTVSGGSDPGGGYEIRNHREITNHNPERET